MTDEHSRDVLIRCRVVLEVTGLGRSSLYNKVRDGEFPRPVALGAHSVAWRYSEVCKWIQSRSHVKPLDRSDRQARLRSTNR